jgi:hypothetical protein
MASEEYKESEMAKIVKRLMDECQGVSLEKR